MTNLTLSLASDHRGFALKQLFATRLAERGHTVIDCGANDETRCDVGDYALRVVADLREHPHHLGIMICGSGQASAMTANRYRHIRAALCTNATMARLAREHNDANVLVLGAHITGQEVALDCLDAFLTATFLGGRYAERRDKLDALGGL